MQNKTPKALQVTIFDDLGNALTKSDLKPPFAVIWKGNEETSIAHFPNDKLYIGQRLLLDQVYENGSCACSYVDFKGSYRIIFLDSTQAKHFLTPSGHHTNSLVNDIRLLEMRMTKLQEEVETIRNQFNPPYKLEWITAPQTPTSESN